MNSVVQMGKAIVAGLGVAMTGLQPTYGKYAWFIVLPALYTFVATYMSAPAITPIVTAKSVSGAVS
jgi:hypothetical protein